MHGIIVDITQKPPAFLKRLMSSRHKDIIINHLKTGTMKKLIITNGNWTAGGNFSGYNPEVGRVHLYGAQMEGLGFKKGEAVKFPLFAIGAEKEFNSVDSEGNPTGEKFSRWQANALFTERKQLAETLAFEGLIDIEVKQFVKAEATSAGLTETEITALLEATI